MRGLRSLRSGLQPWLGAWYAEGISANSLVAAAVGQVKVRGLLVPEMRRVADHAPLCRPTYRRIRSGSALRDETATTVRHSSTTTAPKPNISP